MQHVGFSSPTRDQTWVSCIGSVASQQPDHQENPFIVVLTCIKPQHSENEDHGIWSHHFIGVLQLEIDGETVETVSDFIFWGSKITADGDCSHEIKRHSLEEKL